MVEEFEYENDEKDDSGGTKVLPDGVMERITAQAERTKQSVEDVEKEFLEYIAKEFGCDDAYAQDDDLLMDWSETAFVSARRSSGGGGDTTTFVGCFVGIGEKKNDRMENLRRRNIQDYTKDPAQVIESGRLGAWSMKDGKWHLHTAGAVKESDAPVDEDPPYAFKADGEWVSFVSKVGKNPYPSIRIGRYLYFLGNEESKFVNEGLIELWRVDATNDDADMNVDIGRAVRIQVRPPNENTPDSMKDVLGTNSNFSTTLDYTDEFVTEENRSLLSPNNLWMNNDYHDMYVPLEELSDAYEARSRMIEFADGRKVKAGPLVFAKGTITSMSTEPRESQYEQEGYNFSMSITSKSNNDEEVMCWIPGAVGNQAAPFMAGWEEQEFAYAERSTVLIFGRLKLRIKDGKSSPQLNAFGVYGDPIRVRRRATGGDTSVDQFKEVSE